LPRHTIVHMDHGSREGIKASMRLSLSQGKEEGSWQRHHALRVD
jgi:hypothetical protein